MTKAKFNSADINNQGENYYWYELENGELYARAFDGSVVDCECCPIEGNGDQSEIEAIIPELKKAIKDCENDI